jgi:hypothetical protein
MQNRHIIAIGGGGFLMEPLLTREHFVQSGIIHNLDDGDPEIIYVKQLRTK